MVVVGLIWALLGVANIVKGFENGSGETMKAVSLVVNMLFFVLPGLVCAGLGQILRRRGAPSQTEGQERRKCPHCADVYPEEMLTPPLRRCLSCAADGLDHEMEPHVGVEGMTLIDLMEMLCDWKAASERHADGDVLKSIGMNQKRFNVSPQLQAILLNSAKEMLTEE